MQPEPESKERLLALAEEAEKAAEAAPPGKLKDAWLKIARNYRDLAANKTP